ncbi:MAG: hypothetical protein BJ554DRAFT_5262 [Olpidium bornovanus]|uniref:Uncharacterized protein n=1 Tax=Olpidium bornovanus TaxID=278681 RepID=A0A8H7ZZS0_9FUNG|nr:MAG: hypothetical protein BJ554DRAFT_5262 [Olpidium bornovanus]
MAPSSSPPAAWQTGQGQTNAVDSRPQQPEPARPVRLDDCRRAPPGSTPGDSVDKAVARQPPALVSPTEHASPGPRSAAAASAAAAPGPALAVAPGPAKSTGAKKAKHPKPVAVGVKPSVDFVSLVDLQEKAGEEADEMERANAVAIDRINRSSREFWLQLAELNRCPANEDLAQAQAAMCRSLGMTLRKHEPVKAVRLNVAAVVAANAAEMSQ